MKKVLIIGSNSFSGAHFIDLLLEKNQYQVIGISRSKEKKEIYLPYKKRTTSKLDFYQLDLNNNMKEIMSLIDIKKPEYIVNFASQSIVGASWDNPAHWYKTNVQSIIELTDFLRKKEFLKKYVHISTPEVYGSCKGNVDESAAFNPSTPYAASRAAADIFIQLLIKQFQFPAVFTRAANVFGPSQQLFKIIPRSIIYIKQNKKIPLHGGGEAKRSFIHIKDVCEATLDCMEKAEPGEIYHLSTDQLISIKELVKLICEKMNVNFSESIEVVETRRGLDDAYILNSEKAKQKFNWIPKIELEEGIYETIKWIDDNWKEISNEPLEYIHKE